MNHLRTLARSVAATAVAGIALIGMSGAAGATSISVSVPPLISGNGSGEPIVTVGSGTVSPVPGTNVTVPLHAEGHVPSSRHATSSVPVPVPDPTGNSLHIVSTRGQHVWIDACIAAAVLSNHSPSACHNALGDVTSSLPTSAATSELGGTAALPQALANVGGCVKIALASGAPIDTCTTPAVIDPGSITRAVPGAPSVPSVPGAPAIPGTDLGSLPTGDVGSLPTGDVGSLPAELGTLPATLGTLPSGTALDDGTVADQLAKVGLCPIAKQLGISSLLSCANSASAPTLPVGTAGNPLSSSDMCLGLAAVIGVDTGSCSNGSNSAPSAHTTVKARHDGGKATVHTRAPEANFNSSCTANVGQASSSPLSPTTAGGIAGLGFGLASIGKVLRRFRRPALI